MMLRTETCWLGVRGVLGVRASRSAGERRRGSESRRGRLSLSMVKSGLGGDAAFFAFNRSNSTVKSSFFRFNS